MTDVLRGAGFDYIFIETVGVGQSEVDITGLADITLLVLVPESGDEIQNLKSGLMEIADAFIINKADRPDAYLFANNLKKVIDNNSGEDLPVLKTIASTDDGIGEVIDFFTSATHRDNKRKEFLLAEKAYHIIQQKRMADIDKRKLQHDIKLAYSKTGFNFYRFIENYAGE